MVCIANLSATSLNVRLVVTLLLLMLIWYPTVGEWHHSLDVTNWIHLVHSKTFHRGFPDSRHRGTFHERDIEKLPLIVSTIRLNWTSVKKSITGAGSTVISPRKGICFLHKEILPENAQHRDRTEGSVNWSNQFKTIWIERTKEKSKGFSKTCVKWKQMSMLQTRKPCARTPQRR